MTENDPGPVPEEGGDPFAEGVKPLDLSRPVELADLNIWLLDVAMHYTNAVELVAHGDDSQGFYRLLNVFRDVSPTLRRVAATFLPELFEGVEVELVEVVTTDVAASDD